MPITEEQDGKTLTEKFRTDYAGKAAVIERGIEVASGGELRLTQHGRNEEEADLIEAVNEVHMHMAELKTYAASIVWMHPWEGRAQGPLLDNIIIPPCPIDQQFVHYVVRDYKVDIRDKGGKFNVAAVTPIALSKDFVGQHVAQRRGGLAYYMGAHRPFTRKESEQEEKELIEKTAKARVVFYRRLAREAETEFHRPNKVGWANITQMHRLAMQWLLHHRAVSKAPEWLSEERPLESIPDPCPKCGAEPAAGAFACAQCNWIIDPAAAYRLGEIEEDNVALRRCTREELDKLKLKHVQTLAEFRSTPKKAKKEAE